MADLVTNSNTFIDAINEYMDFPYIEKDHRQDSIDNMVKTRDTIEDFKQHQKHYETRKTTQGVMEVFFIRGGHELTVMDFGDYRLALTDF